MIIVVIPAYNEEANIPILLLKLQRAFAENGFDYTVLVVNDGSTDRTAEIVADFAGQMPVRLLNHEMNQGAGRAFRTGFAAALQLSRSDDDLVVTMEADNTSDLAILRRMIEQAASGYDLVLASCYAPGGGIQGTTAWRVFLSGAANLLLRLRYGLHGIHTYSSFYRVYRAGALRMAYEVYGDELITEPGFVCAVELLVKMSRLPLHIGEVPMVLQCDFRRGKSKMRIWRTIRGYMRFIWKDWIDTIVARKAHSDR